MMYFTLYLRLFVLCFVCFTAYLRDICSVHLGMYDVSHEYMVYLRYYTVYLRDK